MNPPSGEPTTSRDQGVSLVEVLVAMGLFAVLGTLLLGLALSTSEVSDDTRQLANVSEESRLAMERMARELRQASEIDAAQLPPAGSTETTALTFWADFDGDGAKDTSAADPEVLTYRWNPTTHRLTLTANDASGTAVTRPVLASNVSRFVVGLESAKWEYDADGDGVTTWHELDAAGAPVGNANAVPDEPELNYINLVTLTMTVLEGSHAQTYSTQVDLRNRR
jgi:prepilin-type N-terminal cleavage/methylation domain-containing protein